MNMNNILVVAAHPDDDILGCGGLLHKYRDREVHVVFLAEGTSCRYPLEEINQDQVRQEMAQRNQAGVDALARLGVLPPKFCNLPCGRLDTMPIIDLGKIVESEIYKRKPDTILTHSSCDANNDHRLVFQAVLQASRPGTLNRVNHLLSFEVLSSSEWRFEQSFLPNVFIPLSEEDMQAKVDAFNIYDTEKKAFPFPRCEEGIRYQGRVRGMQVGEPYCEAFKLIRGVLE